jgi:hypothetical protein
MALLGAGLILAGCKASSSTDDSVDDGLPKATSVQFEGSPNVALAGTWTSTQGDSIYELDKDGKLKMTSVVHIPGSKEAQKRERDGQWGVSGQTLFTKTTDSSGDTVAKYDFEQKGNTLTLSLASLKVKAVFHRK